MIYCQGDIPVRMVGFSEEVQDSLTEAECIVDVTPAEVDRQGRRLEFDKEDKNAGSIEYFT